MFVRELFHTELARVEVLAEVDVPVHPHVVAGRVVLPAVHAHKPLPAVTCKHVFFEKKAKQLPKGC